MASTLSMIMTFLLYCILKNSRASGFFIQNSIIDVSRDYLLHLFSQSNDFSIGLLSNQALTLGVQLIRFFTLVVQPIR